MSDSISCWIPPLDQYKNTFINLFAPEYSQEVGYDFSLYKELEPQSQAVVEDVFSWFVLLNYTPRSMVSDKQIRDKLERLLSVPEYEIPDEYARKALHMVQSWVCPIQRILKYLNEHYPEKITDEVLLQEGKISRAVMYRHFKRILNCTYSQYLQMLRCKHAHICLRDTTYTLSYIARICGFYDNCHMSQIYTKYMGMSPGNQRKILRELYANAPRHIKKA